jgi:replicative DNA helicase
MSDSTQSDLKAPRGLLDCRLGIQAKEVLERLQQGTQRVLTGFTELDRILGGGLPVPTLGILGAKPKCGKSTFLQQLVSYIVLHGGYAYVVDRENGIDRYVRRLVCSLERIDPNSLGDSFVPTEPWKRAEKAILEGALANRLFIERDSELTPRLPSNRVAELSAMAQADEGAPFIVVLDSLQKLPVKSLNDRRAGIDGWMRALEWMRDRYRAIILVASELKRPPQGQAYKASEVSLKESGDIEYSADLVLTMDRQELKDDDYITDRPPQPAQMRVVFNRDGQTGRVADYRLIYPFHRIEEEARPHYEGIRKANLASVSPIRSYLESTSGPEES